MSRILLMGDPAHFRIKAGANPHTRNRWGMRKHVDTDLARRQWDQARKTFLEYGLRVEVIPADKDCPGMVFPANAGFLLQKDATVPLNERDFYLSNLVAGRAKEKDRYRSFLKGLGLRVHDLGTKVAFEGEADFFPAGDGYIFTHGRIKRAGWAPALGWPPYRRRYGFRSDLRALDRLKDIAKDKEILALELRQEAYYHGDTVFCVMGRRRQHLLVYAEGLTPEALNALKSGFHGHPIFLSDADAAAFAANSLYVDTGEDQLLFCPKRISEEILKTLRDLHIRPIPLDVSEFFSKGGGSIKCMLCDLGQIGVK